MTLDICRHIEWKDQKLDSQGPNEKAIESSIVWVEVCILVGVWQREERKKEISAVHIAEPNTKAHGH